MKKTKIIGYHVIVEPSTIYASKDVKEIKQICESIISDIQRHADDVQSAYLKEEIEEICQHCGSVWTETSEKYNGGCCDGDESGQQ